MDVSSTGLLRCLGRAAFGAIALSLSLSACGQAPSETEREPATASIEERYEAATKRLVERHLENNWVVTRRPDGSPEHVGEGLLWTGVALAALPCEAGDAPEAMLIDMMARHRGGLVRYEPLGEYAGGREVTLDGALGLYLGVAERAKRCARGPAWASTIKRHVAFLVGNGYRFHLGAPARLVPEFTYVVHLLDARLSSGPAPDSSRAGRLANQVAAWAVAVHAKKAACYRVNLGLIALQTVEALGVSIPDEGRRNFCLATKGMDIPTVEHWCGRGEDTLRQWIDAYKPNKWEYFHQRCGAWESPDGDGDETPGLDLLVAMRAAYQL